MKIFKTVIIGFFRNTISQKKKETRREKNKNNIYIVLIDEWYSIQNWILPILTDFFKFEPVVRERAFKQQNKQASQLHNI